MTNFQLYVQEALQMAGECQSHFEKRGSQPLLPTEVVRLRDVAIPEGMLA